MVRLQLIVSFHLAGVGQVGGAAVVGLLWTEEGGSGGVRRSEEDVMGGGKVWGEAKYGTA